MLIILVMNKGDQIEKITLYNQRTFKLLSVLQFGTSSERYQSNAISNETDDDSDCYVCTRELAGAPNYSVGYNCCLSDTPPPPRDPQMLRCSVAQITINKKNIEQLPDTPPDVPRCIWPSQFFGCFQQPTKVFFGCSQQLENITILGAFNGWSI